MVVLFGARDLRNLLEAGVVRIWLSKWKGDVQKVFAKSCNVGNAGCTCYGNHGLRWVNADLADCFILMNKFPEQVECMFRFSSEKIAQGFVAA